MCSVCVVGGAFVRASVYVFLGGAAACAAAGAAEPCSTAAPYKAEPCAPATPAHRLFGTLLTPEEEEEWVAKRRARAAEAVVKAGRAS